MISIDEILLKIENKTVTTDDFNLLLEANSKSVRERIHRKTRITTDSDGVPDPVKAIEHKVKHKSNNDPTQTATGKRSVARQAKRNKKHPERFIEAIEFVNKYHNTSIDESIKALNDVNDKNSLTLLLNKLSSIDKYKSWCESIVSNL